MKFSDGNWMMLPGVKPAYAAEVYEAEDIAGGVEILAPTRKIRHRGDTLEGPVLTVRLTSPATDVIRVQASHFQGTAHAKPSFELWGSPDFQPEVILASDVVRLISGQVEAWVSREDWQIHFFGGRAGVHIDARSRARSHAGGGAGKFHDEPGFARGRRAGLRTWGTLYGVRQEWPDGRDLEQGWRHGK